MSNLTIKWRLLLSFAVVVLVVLSSMVVQLIYNNRLDNEVHRLALSYNLALKAESLDTQILTVVSSLRGFELTGTEANLTALEAAKKRAYELNDEMIAVWSRMGASRKDQLERAEKIKVLFNVLLKEVVEPCIIERKLVNEGKHDMNQMSEFVSKYSATPRVAAINAVMVELLNKSAENVQIIRNNYTSMQQTAAWVAQSAAVTVLVLSLLIAIWTANHIARRLAMAGEVVEATARGDLTVRINAEGRDEIARLLDSVIRMQNQLSTVFRGFIENAEQISGQSNQLASTAEQLLQRPVRLYPLGQTLLDASRSDWDLAQLEFANSGRNRLQRRLGSGLNDVLHAPAWRPARWPRCCAPCRWRPSWPLICTARWPTSAPLPRCAGRPACP